MTPSIPQVFPFKVGDVVVLERQTLYYQNSQSFKQTKRTIKSITIDEDMEGAWVTFNESLKKFRIYLKYDGSAKVTSNKTRYDILSNNDILFAWHNINIADLD